MSKKMMLLALAVVSAAAFVLPAGASAAELHLTNVTSFSGTFASSTLTVNGEPVVTCENTGKNELSSHVSGTVNPGGTTGTIELDFTHCHIVVLGFTIECHTAGAPVNNTIKSSGPFRFITTNEKPGVLVEPVKTTLACGGTKPIVVEGKIIGTITSPTCGGTSNNMTIKFSATGATQEDKSYTGTSNNLTAETEGTKEVKEAGLVSTATVSSATAGTLDCT